MNPWSRLLKHWLKGKAASFQWANPHLHPKASVWFVSPILSQCLLVCHGRERSHNGPSFLRPGMLQEALYEPLDPSLIYKRHLYIYLKTENKGGNSTLATGCAFTLQCTHTWWVQSQQNKKQYTKWHHSTTALGWEQCLGAPSRLMTQATASSESEWGNDDKDTMARRSSLERTRLTQPGISRLRNGMSDPTGQDCTIKVKSLLQFPHLHLGHSPGQESHSHPTPISKGCVCETHPKQLCTPQTAPD